MPGEGVLLVLSDRIIAHAGEEIVGAVVFAGVFETEPLIFRGTVPSLGRAVRRRLFTVRPFARREIRTQAAIPIGLHPDPVEKRRIFFHRDDYAVVSMAASRLDRVKSTARGD